MTYPNDSTGPSLDRAGDYDPDWDLPSNDEPDLNRWDASDIVGVIMWALAIVVIGWALLFSPASAEAHVPGADLGPSNTEWLIDPYSPLPAQTIEATLDTVLKTRPADLPRTLGTLRPRLYAAAMGSIENWDRTSGFVKNNAFDDACWSVQETQQRLWYELAQFYNDPPRGPFKRRLVRVLRNLVNGEIAYHACWEKNRPHEGTLQ